MRNAREEIPIPFKTIIIKLLTAAKKQYLDWDKGL